MINRVNKIVSLNPDRFESKPKWVALGLYIEYIQQIAILEARGETYYVKSFQEWLDTEI